MARRFRYEGRRHLAFRVALAAMAGLVPRSPGCGNFDVGMVALKDGQTKVQQLNVIDKQNQKQTGVELELEYQQKVV